MYPAKNRTILYCLALIIVSVVLFSTCRPSIDLIENLYKKGNIAEFENILAELHAETILEFEKNSGNDTIVIVNSLFNSILAEEINDKPSRYFFLQPYWPEIFVDNQKRAIKGRFIANLNYGDCKPIMYDFDLVEQIVRFLNQGNKNEGSKKSNQPVYSQRLEFIGQHLNLSYTWGNLNTNLNPYKIESIRFNSSLTQAEIKYNFVYRGADEIFQFDSGNWTKVRTILKWLE